MKIGLLGGSFDPIHKGHLALATAALRELALDRVYFILNPLSPFKTSQPLTPVRSRLSLLRKAIRVNKKFKVGLWEIKQRKPSFTIDTLKKIKKEKPKDHLFFIMGSDSWKSFSKWKSPEKILELSTVVIGRRPGNLSVKIPKALQENTHLLKGRFPAISSTEIRSRRGTHQASWWTPNSVMPRYQCD